MSDTSSLSIKGITQKSIFLMASFSFAVIGAWRWLEPSLKDRELGNLISVLLIATMIAPLSILIFIHFYAGNSPEKLLVDSSKLIKSVVGIVVTDCILTVAMGQIFSIPLTDHPATYFLSFLSIVIGCVIFLFNIQDIRDQLENESSPHEKWADAFWLMSSTFWVFIPVFFFVGRTRKN